MEDERQALAVGDLQTARLGAWAAFCITGLVSASWAGRIPAVAERLELSPGGLGIVVAGVEGGALLGLTLGGAVVSRWGSRLGLRAGVLVFAPGLLVAALAPSLTWLAVGLGVWAAANSVIDVASNAQGVELERRAGRPVLSGLHAAQGVGLLVGALAATVLAALSVGLLAHLSGVAAVALIVGLAATLPLLREPPDPGSRPRSRQRWHRPQGRLLVLGVVAFCAFLIDGAATNWISVHLRTGHDAAPGLAAAGYLVFTAALVVGRLRGDRLNAQQSRARIVLACGLLAAAGTAVAVLAPTSWIALVGWALVGLAVAPLAPTVLSAAADIAGAEDSARSADRAEAALPVPAAIAAVTTMGYLGSFTGPPLIGALAEVMDLSLALAVIALAGLCAALLARRLPPRKP